MLEAPREQVFRMLTEPAELAKWWGPGGLHYTRGHTRPSTRRQLPADR